MFILQSYSCYWPLILILLSVRIILTPITAEGGWTWNVYCHKGLIFFSVWFVCSWVSCLWPKRKKAARPRTMLHELMFHSAASTCWLEMRLEKDSHYVVSELTYQYEHSSDSIVAVAPLQQARRFIAERWSRPPVPFFYTLHELPMAAIKTTFTTLVLRLRTAKPTESIAQSERCSCWNCKMLVLLNLQPLLLHPSGLRECFGVLPHL